MFFRGAVFKRTRQINDVIDGGIRSALELNIEAQGASIAPRHRKAMIDTAVADLAKRTDIDLGDLSEEELYRELAGIISDNLEIAARKNKSGSRKGR